MDFKISDFGINELRDIKKIKSIFQYIESFNLFYIFNKMDIFKLKYLL
jgi:hypothetical protein